MIEPCDKKSKGKTLDWPQWSTWESGRDYQTPGLAFLKIPSAVRSEMQNDKYYLRSKIKQRLAKGNFCYSFYIQPFVSEKETPIENTTKIWHWSKEEKNSWLDGAVSALYSDERNESLQRKIIPRVKVGEITIYNSEYSKQGSRSCEDLSFNPWNNVPEAHRPLGIIQRVKRAAYHASSSTRFEKNHINESVQD